MLIVVAFVVIGLVLAIALGQMYSFWPFRRASWVRRSDTAVSRHARASLADHASDPRPEAETLTALLRGKTRDETWNACQRQFLALGWMHNNLRMYWAKRIIAMTPDPETAWATACYLNDRFSLDGRDPSTYGNIATMFGGAPESRDRPVFGTVAARGDGSTRRRDGGPAWLAEAAASPVPEVTVPTGDYCAPYL